jgi:hypothetical protein
MFQNNFFISTLNLNKIILNKYFSKNIYPKYLIRKLTLTKQKKFILLDNYSSKHLVFSKTYNRVFSHYLLKRGCSLVSEPFIYKSSKLHFLFFEGLTFKTKPYNIASLLLKRLKFWSNKEELFFLYKITQGGYLGFSKGIIGFIPKNQLLNYNGTFNAYKKYIILKKIGGINYSQSNFSTFKISPGGTFKNLTRVSIKQRLHILGRLNFTFHYYPLFLDFWLNFILFSKFFILKNKNFLFKNFFKKLLKYLL